MRSDGSVDLSKVTLTVGDQKGGSQALLKAAGEDGKHAVQDQVEVVHLRAAAARGAERRRHRPRRRGQHAAAVRGRRQEQDQGRLRRHDGRQGRHDRGPEGLRASSPSPTSRARRSRSPRAARPTTTCSPSWPRPGCPTTTSRCRTCSRPTRWRRSPPGTSTPGRSGTRTPRRPRSQAKARILADGSGLVNGMTFQAANPDALDDKATAAAIKDYLGRLAKAQVWSNTHRDAVGQGLVGGDRALARRHPQGRRPPGRASRCRSRPEVVDSEQKMADTFVDDEPAARPSSTSATTSPTTSTLPSPHS